MVGMAVCLSVSAWADDVSPAYSSTGESLVILRSENFSGGVDETLTGTGISGHGSAGGETRGALRLYDPAGAPGMYDIGYKGGPGNSEWVSHVFSPKPPAAGSALFGGGQFSGQALWVCSGLFQKGKAPAVGEPLPGDPLPTGTWWNGDIRTAGNGADFWGTNGGASVKVPVRVDETIVATYYLSQQVFIPDHTEDGVPAGRSANFGVYLDRVGYGLIGSAGHDSFRPSLSLGQWHQIEARVTITTCGGTEMNLYDDTASMTCQYFVDGVAVGDPKSWVLGGWFNANANSDWTDTPGYDLNLFWGDSIDRGWQNSVPEFYVTNIVIAEIVPVSVPEPATMSLLVLGGLAMRRRK